MPPRAYKAILVKFMSHLHSTDYAVDHEFSQEELTGITPNDIVEWCNIKTFGEPNPPLDADPTQARSNSKFWKKAISAYMPNRMMKWNEISQLGNPTKSTEINDLIKRVTKKEVRRQGAPSQARRAMKQNDYESMQSLLKNITSSHNTSYCSEAPQECYTCTCKGVVVEDIFSQ